jgi:hypothetical protein
MPRIRNFLGLKPDTAHTLINDIGEAIGQGTVTEPISAERFETLLTST